MLTFLLAQLGWKMGMPWSLVFCSVLLASEPLSATVAPSPVRRGQGHLRESPVLCWDREKPDSPSLQTSVSLLVTVTGKEKHLHRTHNSFLSLASESQITHFFVLYLPCRFTSGRGEG